MSSTLPTAMKNILVLVDFTETAAISVRQAIALAKAKGAKVHISHIFPDNEKEAGLRSGKFDAYLKACADAGVECAIEAGEGDLVHEAQEIVEKLNVDLVVVGTHGKHGVKQNIFGSHIYNLVKRIPAPALVVSGSTRIKEEGFRKVMLPVGSHSNYIHEVKQTCELLADGGTVVIFAIIKPGIPLDESIVANVEAAKEEFNSHGVNWEYMEIDSGVYSIGYSHETLEYLGKHDMDLIVIMTEVSDVNRHFGKIDKENVILNDLGVPVLCSH